ncbi:30S ribosomal protein S5 [Candidatus Woesearchaeota archaeon]|nr:30S ribosomal protein S5 [Candidatus Woesearchaeota archaeon]
MADTPPIGHTEEVVTPIEEEKIDSTLKSQFSTEKWKPKTGLGKKVKAGQIKSIREILDTGERILEPEIVDALVQNAAIEMMMIGQAKGKFGGGQRRVFKQTQKKTAEGNKPSFAICVTIGNKNGLIGIGWGKSRETVPAREKAIRNAKLNLIKIRRGCGSWQCGCKEAHSIPFEVSGKCGSVKISLIPAPKGTGLVVQEECKKMLAAAGIKDAWSKTMGQTRTTINLIKACEEALKKLIATKLPERYAESLGVKEGETEISA